MEKKLEKTVKNMNKVADVFIFCQIGQEYKAKFLCRRQKLTEDNLN